MSFIYGDERITFERKPRPLVNGRILIKVHPDCRVVVTLNPNLVKAPRECIDYVILHELCHLAEHNHSERFYRLMGQVMPEWEKTKKRLDGMAGMIFSDL